MTYPSAAFNDSPDLCMTDNDGDGYVQLFHLDVLSLNSMIHMETVGMETQSKPMKMVYLSKALLIKIWMARHIMPALVSMTM